MEPYNGVRVVFDKLLGEVGRYPARAANRLSVLVSKGDLDEAEERLLELAQPAIARWVERHAPSRRTAVWQRLGDGLRGRPLPEALTALESEVTMLRIEFDALREDVTQRLDQANESVRTFVPNKAALARAAKAPDPVVEPKTGLWATLFGVQAPPKSAPVGVDRDVVAEARRATQAQAAVRARLMALTEQLVVTAVEPFVTSMERLVAGLRTFVDGLRHDAANATTTSARDIEQNAAAAFATQRAPTLDFATFLTRAGPTLGDPWEAFGDAASLLDRYRTWVEGQVDDLLPTETSALFELAAKARGCLPSELLETEVLQPSMPRVLYDKNLGPGAVLRAIVRCADVRVYDDIARRLRARGAQSVERWDAPAGQVEVVQSLARVPLLGLGKRIYDLDTARRSERDRSVRGEIDGFFDTEEGSTCELLNDEERERIEELHPHVTVLQSVAATLPSPAAVRSGLN